MTDDVGYPKSWLRPPSQARGRRLATKLAEKLLPSLRGEAVYATSSVNNVRMHASLYRVGFRIEGVPYPSKINEPLIQLFVRERTSGPEKRKPARATLL